MRAGWLIDDDRIDEAIVTLRSALGQTPEDAEAMTLMARAHERAGNRDLMADMLSRAVEASGNAPEETLRYARHLISRTTCAAPNPCWSTRCACPRAMSGCSRPWARST